MKIFPVPSCRASSELRSKRLAVCASCDLFRQPLKQCSLCGCFMLVKAWLKLAKCPAGKW
jgi:hypothetical protein